MSETHIPDHKDFELGLDENCGRCMDMKVYEMGDGFFKVVTGISRDEFERELANKYPQFRDVLLNANAYRIKIEREAAERRARRALEVVK